MPINYVPSAWDYAAQGIEGITGGLRQIKEDKAKEKALAEEKKRKEWQQKMETLQTLLSSYNADKLGADQINPMAKELGIPEFGPNMLDRRNIILANPQGNVNPGFTPTLPSNIPAQMPPTGIMQSLLSAGGQPPVGASPTGGIPSMGMGDLPQIPDGTGKPAFQVPLGQAGQVAPSGMFKMPTAPKAQDQPFRPWTDAELKMAGLPTQLDELKNHLELGKHTAGLEYLNGGNVTPQAAELLGVKTPKQLETSERKGTDPLIGEAADRYVAQSVIAMPGATPTTKNVNQLAGNAFNAWMKDREMSKLGQLTPEDTTYAKSFFAKAAATALTEAQKMELDRMKAAAMQERGVKSPLAVIESVRAHLDDAAADVYKANKFLSMPNARSMPENAEAFKQLDLIARQKAVLGKALTLGSIDALSPEDKKLISQLAVTQLDGQQTGGPPPLGVNYGPALQSLQGKPLRAALAEIDAKVNAGRLSVTDAAQLKKDLGIK